MKRTKRASHVKPASHRKICVVTRRLIGPSLNRQIAVIGRNPGVVLRELGHDVDIVCPRAIEEGSPEYARKFSNCVDAFKAHGIRLLSLDCDGKIDDWLGYSYCVLQYLLKHRYDLVFFDDQFGSGYYSLLARSTGNPAFLAIRMCVVARGASEYLFDINQRPILNFNQLRLAEIERRSIELADAVLASSSSVLEKYAAYGWKIPANHIVSPHLIAASQSSEQPHRRVVVREIVFFGRLEAGSGLWLFCRALDRVSWKLKGIRVTFLGESTNENGVDTSEILLRRSARWPLECRMLTNFDHDQAFSYLEGSGRVAVLNPSEELRSAAVSECLCRRIPFLVGADGAVRELLDERSRQANTFEPTVDHLCEKLEAIGRSGAVTGQPKADQQALRSAFEQWTRQLLDAGARKVSASKARAAKMVPVLVVVVPPECPAVDVENKLSQAIEDFEGNVQFELLVTDPGQLKTFPKSPSNKWPVRVRPMGEFPQLIQSLARSRGTVVGLCHLTQILPAAWVKRGSMCFEAGKDISMLTGLAVQKADPRPASSTIDIEAARSRQNSVRYITGNTSPLFPLSLDTNSGFALFRSEVLSKCSGIGPLDEPYDRLKSMPDWIHQIAVTLHASGERFELVPDLIVQQPLDEVPFEVFRVEQFMRSQPNALYGVKPGSDQSVLSRIAIDWGLERERALNHSKYVSQISDRIGTTVVHFPLYTPWEEHVRQLAAIAHADGQIDLAIELCAEVAMPAVDQPSGSDEQISPTADSKPIDVIEHLFAHRKSLKFGDLNAWVSWDKSGIEMGVNSEFELPSLDLSNVSHFACDLAIREKFAGPIKFQLEVSSQNDTHCWSVERTNDPNERQAWEFELPESVRRECAVRFKVIVEAAQGPTGEAVARWNNPRFLGRA